MTQTKKSLKSFVIPDSVYREVLPQFNEEEIKIIDRWNHAIGKALGKEK